MDRTFKAVMLHGFLGTSRDWTLVLNSLARQGIQPDVLCPELFQTGPLSADHSFATWTENLLAEVEKRFGQEPVHLLGYSLGGRLAFHAALASPERWRSLWFFSANPGVLVGDKEVRRQWEADWARRFTSLPWEDVMAAWNNQEVFSQSTPRLLPSEGTLNRELLAQAFRNWSLTHPQFSLDALRRLPDSAEWWFGEGDAKFLDVKRELERQNIKGRYRVVEHAGHRLTLDQPEVIAAAIIAGMGDRI